MMAAGLAPSFARGTRAAPAPRERPRAAPRSGHVALALRVALMTFAAVLAVAAVVRVTVAEQARGWLHYSFPGVPPHADVAVGIFLHNGRAILGVLGLLLIAQLAARRPEDPGRAQRLILVAGELILAAVITVNVLVVGAGLGAYGARMVGADLPHGPVELAAYALALSIYLQGRRRALPAAQLAKVVAASVALLALAATLETFVNG
jgi:hypothetical protein